MGDKTSWGSLPKEIRLAILEALLQDGCSLASLATVSREWQTTIERHNFARIRLTPSRLRCFGSMTHRNRALVRYIWVCLELEKYDCPYFDSRGAVMWGDRSMDNIIITTALRDLFAALSAWEPQGDLLLDISLYSPSDSEYWFKELTYVPDFPSLEECDRTLCDLVKAKRARVVDDKEHSWTRAPPKIAIVSAFYALSARPPRAFSVLGWGGPLSFEDHKVWWDRLPEAPAVTGLLLRQQNRRHWNPISVLHIPYRYLFPSLVGLERLVLFENFDQRYPPSLHHCEPVRTASPDVGRSVTSDSLRLKHLSAAFIVDASDVFLSAAREPAWAWPRLTTLALTSRLLAPDTYPTTVDGMLIAAAAWARRMPSLETMEIWNGREGVAGMFRFRSFRRGRTPEINWRGTWDLVLGKDVIQAWETVANMYRRAGLVVVNDKRLDAAKIRFHGDAIHYLGLEAQVVRPVSLYQMRVERDIREVRA
ncbi:hypothetical protein LA080_001041 [Diaporthe eres]|nr:hypothetical protein LA080_001041 [Diaporthe eres]